MRVHKVPGDEKEQVATLPKLSYLPFGGGPRACIGKTFATIEARLILATLAREVFKIYQ